MRFPLPFIRLHALVLGAWLLLAAPALAADGESTPLKLGDGDPTSPATGGGSGASTIVRTIVGLAIVLAVIYGLAWVLRQVKASREGGSAGTGLTSLATLPLGNDRSLHLVRAGDEVVLVGAGSQGVTHVRTWTLDEARRMGLLDQDGPSLPGGDTRKSLLEAVRDKTVIR